MAPKTLNLPAEIFDVQTNVPLIHQVVVAQLAAARAGTASTKTRAEVRGGGRKPYRQKGTGRARQGSTRAPQFAGGGVVHGPKPRDYSQRTPKKMKTAALRGALSDRARHDRIHVIDSLVFGEKASTKAAAAALSGLTERKNMLVVLERGNEAAFQSVRNLPNVHVLVSDQLNTYDVLCADDIVFTQAALDAFVAGPVKADAKLTLTDDVAVADDTTGAAAADESAATEPAALVADDYEGSAAPLEDGSAPEGFTIKGNKDSMKYHAPGGRWYDATVAEVWFQTSEAAQAAGFVEAGSAASVAANEEDEK